MNCSLKGICKYTIWIGMLCAYGALGTLETVEACDPEPLGAWFLLIVGSLLAGVSLIILLQKEGKQNDY